jgi:hypothetical protein
MSELPDFLQVCVDKFWEDNQELRDRFLRDLYVHGYATVETNEAGSRAVDVWLKGRAADSSGIREGKL